MTHPKILFVLCAAHKQYLLRNVRCISNIFCLCSIGKQKYKNSYRAHIWDFSWFSVKCKSVYLLYKQKAVHFAGDCLVRQSTFTTPTLSSLLLAAQASLICVCVCVCVGSSMLLHKQQKLISRYAAAVPIIPTWHHSQYSASPLFLQLSCSHTPTAYNGTFVATVFCHTYADEYTSSKVCCP